MLGVSTVGSNSLSSSASFLPSSLIMSSSGSIPRCNWYHWSLPLHQKRANASLGPSKSCQHCLIAVKGCWCISRGAFVRHVASSLCQQDMNVAGVAKEKVGRLSWRHLQFTRTDYSL